MIRHLALIAVSASLLMSAYATAAAPTRHDAPTLQTGTAPAATGEPIGFPYPPGPPPPPPKTPPKTPPKK